MIVDANVWYWTATGMHSHPEGPHTTGYVEVREVERLLQEAHGRGMQQERERVKEVMRNAGP